MEPLRHLKALRQERGLSQAELARQVGTVQQSISNYETGTSYPDIPILIGLARYFETSVDYMLDLTEVRHRIEPVAPYELNDEEIGMMDSYRRLAPELRKQFNSMAESLNRYQKEN